MALWYHQRIHLFALLTLLLPGVVFLRLVDGAGDAFYEFFHGLTIFSFAAGVFWWCRRAGSTAVVTVSDMLLVLFVLLIPVSWLGNTVTFASLEPFMFWLQGLVLYFLLVVVYRNRGEKRLVEHLLVVLAIWVALGFVLRDLFPAMAWAISPFRPFHLDPNSMATILVPGLFLSLYYLGNAQSGRVRIANMVFLTLYLFVILRSDSRAVWLGLAMSMGFGLLVYTRDGIHSAAMQLIGFHWRVHVVCRIVMVLFWVGLAVFLATLPFWFAMVENYVDGSIGGRLRRWANGVTMVYEFFPFGVGVGNWLDQFPRFRGISADDPAGLLLPFNTILELTAEGGLVLIAGFAVLVTERLVRGDFCGRIFFTKCSLFCLLVVSFFHISFSSNAIVLIWAVVLLLTAEKSCDWKPGCMQIPVRGLVATCVLLSGVVLAFMVVAAHSSVRSAVILYHLSYLDDRPVFSFQSRVASLPGPIRSYLEDVDYRNATPDTLPEGRFATSLVRDTYAEIGSREAGDGRCQAALKWFEAALRRNPQNVQAKTGLCSCFATTLQWQSANRHCAEAVDLAPQDVLAHESLALVLQQYGNWQGARDHFLEAERLVEGKTGDHQFGRLSIPVMSDYLLQRKRIETRLAELDSADSRAPDRRGKARRIAGTPEVHKSLAVFRGRVLFSHNDGGKYNLWRVDGDGTNPQMLSNDPLSPFRLTANSRNKTLYFVSDRGGDYQYSLYAMNLFGREPRRVAPDDASYSVAEYAVSPDGRYLAYKEERGNRRLLFLQDARSGQRIRIPQRAQNYSQLVWSDSGDSLAFVSGRHTVNTYRTTGQEGVLSAQFDWNITDIAFVPDSSQLWVLERGPDETSRLSVVDVESGDRRRIRTGERKIVSLHPVSDRRMLIREFVEDRYLMRGFDTATQTWHQAGPADGVAYVPVIDTITNTAYYLQIGVSDPIRLLALDLDTLAWRPVYGFSASALDKPVPYSRSVLDGTNHATYYLYQPDGKPDAPLVVWLHGSHSSYSPRWHKYAQYFSNAGFAFVALNFSGSTGVPRPDLEPTELRQVQAEEVKMLVEQIRQKEAYRHSPVIALGVSYGTLLADYTLERFPGLFDAVVEYSPLQVSANIPSSLPYLGFLGENDAYADNDAIRAAFADSNDHQYLHVFRNEGHDLRHQDHIIERLEATVSFLESLTRPPALQ